MNLNTMTNVYADPRDHGCDWCCADLSPVERAGRGQVCTACLSGETACDECGKPLRDHEDGCL